MAIKKIVKVWDEGDLLIENIKFLKNKTKNIFFPLTNSSLNILNNLLETYEKTPCAGIAANQLGYDKSIFIGIKEYDESIDEEELEEKESKHKEENKEINEYADNYEFYINPTIESSNKKSIQEEVEGCLSIPMLSLRIKRFNKIKVRYYNKEGKVVKKSLKGFISKLFQHEVDHLNGILMPENHVIEGFIEKESFVTPELYQKLQSELSE